jgi:methyl-accepting chemotaxis protein
MESHSSKAYQVAEKNIATVQNTLTQLSQGSDSMNQVMSLADHCYKISGTANQSTSQGLESVMSTTEGMGKIRDGIQETSKRIKRLGERSQEISGIINIIKDITERTHILALNARIQAATAGEAGKGFSVVAEEVKQLAESSRIATTQIADLIQNIQIETNNTIMTMEQTVTEVVNGTELSEKAYKQMQETRKTTQKLSEAVKQIATSTKAQVIINEEISVYADELRNSAMTTQEELKSQKVQSTKLNNLSKQLIDSVEEFKLPEAD